MKQLSIVISAVALASTCFAQEKTELKDTKDKVSYSIGLDIGSTFKKQKMDINLDVLQKGLKDGVSGAKPLLTEDEVKATMTAYSKEMTEKQMNANKEAGMKNAAAGEVFLSENKKKEGIKTTASGLQYKVLKEGTGPTPKSTDSVTTNYRGTLIDGTEFDSSYKRGEPATFPVSGVIKGWTEALQLMKVGSKYHSDAKFMGNDHVHGVQEITAYDPPARFSFVNVEHDGKEKYTHDFTVHAEGGKTLIERTITFDVPGVRGLGIRLVVPFASKKFDKQAGEKLNSIFSSATS